MTIELPVPSTDLLAEVETATLEANESEVAAISALRQKFYGYAKYNGYIRIANSKTYANGGSPLTDKDWYLGYDGSHVYENAHKRVRGLLACDSFEQPKDSEFAGTNIGTKLYLTEHGEWLELERVGRWSQYQGSAQWWTCGVDLDPDCDMYERSGGSIHDMTDAQVAEEYALSAVLKQLGASMKDLCAKLPDRFVTVKARAELAQRVIEGLK